MTIMPVQKRKSEGAPAAEESNSPKRVRMSDMNREIIFLSFEFFGDRQVRCEAHHANAHHHKRAIRGRRSLTPHSLFPRWISPLSS